MVRDALMVVLASLLLGQAIAAAFWPEALDPWIAAHSSAALRAAGAALMLGGIALLVAAQLDLGASWRIGIEEDAGPGLVTGGLYRFCRNPIFLALLVTVAGYAILLPTALSLALLIGLCVGLRQQAAVEEAYLLGAYGDAYRDYARRVGRFLPGFDKLG
jgi:protein-S-isoprenylcysteine O-methyltransferase Ste14